MGEVTFPASVTGLLDGDCVTCDLSERGNATLNFRAADLPDNLRVFQWRGAAVPPLPNWCLLRHTIMELPDNAARRALLDPNEGDIDLSIQQAFELLLFRPLPRPSSFQRFGFKILLDLVLGKNSNLFYEHQTTVRPQFKLNWTLLLGAWSRVPRPSPGGHGAPSVYAEILGAQENGFCDGLFALVGSDQRNPFRPRMAGGSFHSDDSGGQRTIGGQRARSTELSMQNIYVSCRSRHKKERQGKQYRSVLLKKWLHNRPAGAHEIWFRICELGEDGRFSLVNPVSNENIEFLDMDSDSGRFRVTHFTGPSRSRTLECGVLQTKEVRTRVGRRVLFVEFVSKETERAVSWAGRGELLDQPGGREKIAGLQKHMASACCHELASGTNLFDQSHRLLLCVRAGKPKLAADAAEVLVKCRATLDYAKNAWSDGWYELSACLLDVLASAVRVVDADVWKQLLVIHLLSKGCWRWRARDVSMARTLAEKVALAVNNNPRWGTKVDCEHDECWVFLAREAALRTRGLRSFNESWTEWSVSHNSWATMLLGCTAVLSTQDPCDCGVHTSAEWIKKGLDVRARRPAQWARLLCSWARTDGDGISHVAQENLYRPKRATRKVNPWALAVGGITRRFPHRRDVFGAWLAFASPLTADWLVMNGETKSGASWSERERTAEALMAGTLLPAAVPQRRRVAHTEADGLLFTSEVVQNSLCARTFPFLAAMTSFLRRQLKASGRMLDHHGDSPLVNLPCHSAEFSRLALCVTQSVVLPPESLAWGKSPRPSLPDEKEPAFANLRSTPRVVNLRSCVAQTALMLVSAAPPVDVRALRAAHREIVRVLSQAPQQCYLGKWAAQNAPDTLARKILIQFVADYHFSREANLIAFRGAAEVANDPSKWMDQMQSRRWSKREGAAANTTFLFAPHRGEPARPPSTLSTIWAAALSKPFAVSKTATARFADAGLFLRSANRAAVCCWRCLLRDDCEKNFLPKKHVPKSVGTAFEVICGVRFEKELSSWTLPDRKAREFLKTLVLNQAHKRRTFVETSHNLSLQKIGAECVGVTSRLEDEKEFTFSHPMTPFRETFLLDGGQQVLASCLPAGQCSAKSDFVSFVANHLFMTRIRLCGEETPAAVPAEFRPFLEEKTDCWEVTADGGLYFGPRIGTRALRWAAETPPTWLGRGPAMCRASFRFWWRGGRSDVPSPRRFANSLVGILHNLFHWTLDPVGTWPAETAEFHPPLPRGVRGLAATWCSLVACWLSAFSPGFIAPVVVKLSTQLVSLKAASPHPAVLIALRKLLSEVVSMICGRTDKFSGASFEINHRLSRAQEFIVRVSQENEKLSQESIVMNYQRGVCTFPPGGSERVWDALPRCSSLVDANREFLQYLGPKVIPRFKHPEWVSFAAANYMLARWLPDLFRAGWLARVAMAPRTTNPRVCTFIPGGRCSQSCRRVVVTRKLGPESRGGGARADDLFNHNLPPLHWKDVRQALSAGALATLDTHNAPVVLLVNETTLLRSTLFWWELKRVFAELKGVEGNQPLICTSVGSVRLVAGDVCVDPLPTPNQPASGAGGGGGGVWLAPKIEFSGKLLVLSGVKRASEKMVTLAPYTSQVNQLLKLGFRSAWLMGHGRALRGARMFSELKEQVAAESVHECEVAFSDHSKQAYAGAAAELWPTPFSALWEVFGRGSVQNAVLGTGETPGGDLAAWVDGLARAVAECVSEDGLRLANSVFGPDLIRRCVAFQAAGVAIRRANAEVPEQIWKVGGELLLVTDASRIEFQTTVCNLSVRQQVARWSSSAKTLTTLQKVATDLVRGNSARFSQAVLRVKAGAEEFPRNNVINAACLRKFSWQAGPGMIAAVSGALLPSASLTRGSSSQQPTLLESTNLGWNIARANLRWALAACSYKNVTPRILVLSDRELAFPDHPSVLVAKHDALPPGQERACRRCEGAVQWIAVLVDAPDRAAARAWVERVREDASQTQNHLLASQWRQVPFPAELQIVYVPRT